jgi:hypothetical protein
VGGTLAEAMAEWPAYVMGEPLPERVRRRDDDPDF